MTLTDCIGWPLEMAKEALDKAGVSFRILETRPDREPRDGLPRRPRVMCVRGDVLVIGYFADKVSEGKSDAR